MNNVTHRKLELFTCLHFSKRVCLFDIANGLFKHHFSALMWPHGLLRNPLGLFKKWKEFNQPLLILLLCKKINI